LERASSASAAKPESDVHGLASVINIQDPANEAIER